VGTPFGEKRRVMGDMTMRFGKVTFFTDNGSNSGAVSLMTVPFSELASPPCTSFAASSRDSQLLRLAV
jgi:hypothetical protein